LVTPTDELTGLPLPLVPLNELGEDADWHHHQHPRRSPLLKKDLGGSAVRQSRLQFYDYELHHSGYHHTYLGPPLPETEEDQLATTIMSVAGYMPDFALDFQSSEPRIVKLKPEQRQRLQTSGEIRIGSEDVVKNFIKSYVLSQPIESVNINELTIEEFITTKDHERRRALGHNLLGLIIYKATEPINEVYCQAQKREMLLPGLPGNVRRFTKTLLGSHNGRRKLVNTLYKQLVTA
jgi:hypothetical protein